MEYVKFFITLIIVLFIFWIVDSGRKNQNKKLKEMQENIKEDDNIITYSGISGKVSKVLDDKVLIKVNPSEIEMYIEKWAIAGIDEIKTVNEKKEEK